jgi:hypothetical protein
MSKSNKFTSHISKRLRALAKNPLAWIWLLCLVVVVASVLDFDKPLTEVDFVEDYFGITRVFLILLPSTIVGAKIQTGFAVRLWFWGESKFSILLYLIGYGFAEILKAVFLLIFLVLILAFAKEPDIQNLLILLKNIPLDILQLILEIFYIFVTSIFLVIAWHGRFAVLVPFVLAIFQIGITKLGGLYSEDLETQISSIMPSRHLDDLTFTNDVESMFWVTGYLCFFLFIAWLCTPKLISETQTA